MKNSVKIALTFASFFVFTASIQAFEKNGASILPLLAGPGHHYGQIGQIAPQQNLKIGVCNPSWCHVSAGAKAGWVETARINPNLARTKHQTQPYQASINGATGGRLSSSSIKGQQRQSSTTMTISMEIVAKEGARARSRTNILPFPVPAHRQIRTR